MTPAPVIIDGRPDLDAWRDGRRFGVSRVSRFPPYVYSTRRNAALVHRVAYVEAHWWEPVGAGHALRRLDRPRLVAHCVCNQVLFLHRTRRHDRGPAATTCLVPAPDALLCGRCHGAVPTFGRGGPLEGDREARRAADATLGCLEAAW